MAQFRRDRLDDDVPAELLEYNPQRWASFAAWSDARFEWLLAHKGRTIGGMNAVHVIFEEPPETGRFRPV